MKPLHELVVQHKQLENLDVEEVDEETILNTLESLDGDIETKAVSIAATVRNVEWFAQAVREAAKKMNERSARLEKKAERIRAYLMTQMLSLGRNSIESPEFTMKVKKNPPSVIIDDYDKIPDKYKYDPPEQQKKIDKSLIKADLDRGDEVPGARLDDSGKRLEIKE